MRNVCVLALVLLSGCVNPPPPETVRAFTEHCDRQGGVASIIINAGAHVFECVVQKKK